VLGSGLAKTIYRLKFERPNQIRLLQWMSAASVTRLPQA